MKEKVLTLAKGNFIYEAPELQLSVDKLEGQVYSGEKKTETFTLSNEKGTKIKGFGSTDHVNVQFLPVYHAETNELTVEIHAEELVPGERIQGILHLVTDCGEKEVPYDFEVVSPELRDSEGVVNDYIILQERFRENPENGAKLFFDSRFKEVFLYRDQKGKMLYEHLTKKNTKLHSFEEFMVATGKKEALRFQTDKKEVFYEIEENDIHDGIKIRLNTWGSTGIRVSAEGDFIEPELHVLWTDEFLDEQDVLEFSILADKVKDGKREGYIVLETPYQTERIHIVAVPKKGGQEKKEKRVGKLLFAEVFRQYMRCAEGAVTKEQFRDMVWENRDAIAKLETKYDIAFKGYMNVILKDEKEILEFYRQAEPIDIPKLGSDISEVENYILIEFIKYLYTKKLEDRERLEKLLEGYGDNGYSSELLLYITLQISDRYQTIRVREQELRQKIEKGMRSPLLYSELVRAYCAEPELLKELNHVTLPVIHYGLKHDLINKNLAIAVSFLAERISRFHPLVYAVMEKLYVKYRMPDTLSAICGLLIRNDMHSARYFPWFEKGVEEHLRMTELFESYMYALDKSVDFKLPPVVLSYFRYENHLNESCKAFLYAYIVRMKEEQPEYFRMYRDTIYDFTLTQLSHHRITKDLALLYQTLLTEDVIRGDVAANLPYVMFTKNLFCANTKMVGVMVSHTELTEETYYPIVDGQAKIFIYSPNYQIYFLDEEGNYYAGTVDYECESFLNPELYAGLCYDNGARHPHLLAYLSIKAERRPKLTEEQAEMLSYVVKTDMFREYAKGKLLMQMYDYYQQQKNTAKLLTILDNLEPAVLKRERLGRLASDCIYHGMYEKAEKMLMRYGVQGCEKKALLMLLQENIYRCHKEFSPLLVKWAFYLYQAGVYEKSIMSYLLQYYMGDTKTLRDIYAKCLEVPGMVVDDGSKERVLGQVLFTSGDLVPFERLYLEYYDTGNNRVLVKAFLFALAYDYIVDKADLTEALFVKIEKEALYEKDKVMVLATLKYYSKAEQYSKKQKDFIERHLEECAGEGLILSFMKEFIGKVAVPYEIENILLVQYFADTEKGVFLYEKKEDGSYVAHPMKKVFDGIYTRELLLFEGESRDCYIYQEETGEKSEEMVLKRSESSGSLPGFFQMINQMIEAAEHKDTMRYRQLRRQYEQSRQVAGKLFEIL